MARYRSGGWLFVSELEVTDLTVSNALFVGGDASVVGDSILETIDINGKLTSPSQSFVTALTPGDGWFLAAGDVPNSVLSENGYLTHTSTGGASGAIYHFPLSSALAPILLQGSFYLEDIQIFYYTEHIWSRITRTAVRRVNIITRTGTDEPDQIEEHGADETGNNNYTLTVNKILDPDYWWMLRILIQCQFGTENHINAFRVRGKFV